MIRTARIAGVLQTIICGIHMLLCVSVMAVAVGLHRSLEHYRAALYPYSTLIPVVATVSAGLDMLAATAAHITLLRRRPMPLCYVSLIVAAFFTIKSVVFVMGFAYQSYFYNYAEIYFDHLALTYLENPQPVDDIQINLDCCGKTDAGDWFNITGFIPASCCPKRNPGITESRCRIPEDFFTVTPYGCLSRLEALLEHGIISVLLILMLGVQITQALLFCTACIGSASLRMQEKQNNTVTASGTTNER
ncbi:tetraspanin-6-like [Schistocerca gregaria]|uniref:tetraspanin-6-like n=1 Tax=Schistocerca gregaria TaxID=7010 RepID=UPI00211DEF9B|nr:tetraspanin-6-like [Schistocerca gregaria]